MKKRHYAGIGLICLATFFMFSESDAEKAEQAGFSTVIAYNRAIEAGFETRDEWDAHKKREELGRQAKLRGFASLEDMEDASVRGFETAKAEGEAKAAGFDNNGDYQAHLAEAVRKKEEEISQKKSEELRQLREQGEQIRKQIKKYLGPCSGNGCSIALQVATEMLAKYRKYEKGFIDVSIVSDSGSNFSSLAVSNGSMTVTHAQNARLQDDVVAYDRSVAADIFLSNYKKYGPVVLEHWGYSDLGFNRFKDEISDFFLAQAKEHMEKLEGKSSQAWDDF